MFLAHELFFYGSRARRESLRKRREGRRGICRCVWAAGGSFAEWHRDGSKVSAAMTVAYDIPSAYAFNLRRIFGIWRGSLYVNFNLVKSQSLIVALAC